MSGRSPPYTVPYTYINHHAQLPVILHSYEDSTNVDNSTIEPYKNRGLGNQKNVGVYCTIALIAMHGYRTNTEYTGSLGYNSVYRKIRTHLDLLSLLHYIYDRMGVTAGDLSVDVDVILGNCTKPFVIRVYNEKLTPA